MDKYCTDEEYPIYLETLFAKYELDGKGKPKTAALGDLVNKSSVKDRKAVLKKQYKNWNLKDNGEPKDKKKDKARFELRLKGFFSQFDAKEYQKEYEGKYDREDEAFRELTSLFNTDAFGVPHYNKDISALVLNAFYYTIGAPEKIETIPDLVKKIKKNPTIMGALIHAECEASGQNPEMWDQWEYSEGVLIYRFENFFRQHDPDNARDLVLAVLEEIRNEDINDVQIRYIKQYNANQDEWLGDFPHALREGPIRGDDEGEEEEAAEDHEEEVEHAAEDHNSSSSSSQGSPVVERKSSVIIDDPIKRQYIAGFFERFSLQRDATRVAEFMSINEPVSNILDTLASEYNIPSSEIWDYSVWVKFSEDVIRSDWETRLEKFFKQHNVTARMGPLVDGIIREKMGDKDAWTQVYTSCRIGLGQQWIPSLLPGAPPASSPMPGADMMRRSSIVSQRSLRSGMGSRKGSLASIASSHKPRAQNSSFVKRNSVTTLSTSRTPMVIPGTITLHSLDFSRVTGTDNARKVKSAVRWDISKAFSHALEMTFVDGMKGQPGSGPTIIEFHFNASGEDSNHVHATCLDILKQRNLVFPSLSQGYKQSTNILANCDVDYNELRTQIRHPISAKSHDEHLKESEQTAKAQLRDKLFYFHCKHAPGNVNDIDGLMRQSGTLDEVDLFRALYSRYLLGEYDDSFSGDDWREKQNRRATSRNNPKTQSGSELSQKLRLFFSKVEPANRIQEKTDEAIASMHRTNISEDELFERLRSAYSIDQPTGQTPASRTPQEEASLRQRLTDFYLAHNPSELYKVELAMHAVMPEDVLFAKLHQRYGLPTPHTREAPARLPTSEPAAALVFDEMLPPIPSVPSQSLTDWERQLTAREEALSHGLITNKSSEAIQRDRELKLEEREAKLQIRWREVSEREAAVAEKETSLRMMQDQYERDQRLVKQSRSLSPTLDVVADDKLRRLTTRLETQLREVATREDAVSLREQDLIQRERSLATTQINSPGTAAVSTMISDQMHSIEIKEKLLDERAAMANKRDSELEKMHQMREEELRQKEQRFNERHIRLDGREQDISERERRIQAEEQNVSNMSIVREKELEDRYRELSIKEISLAEKEVAREQQLSERESALLNRQAALAAESSAVTEKQNILMTREEDLHRLQLEGDARNRHLRSEDEEAVARLRKVAEREQEMEDREREIKLRMAEGLDLIGRKEGQCRVAADEVARLEAQLRDQHIAAARKQKEFESREIELSDREDRFTLREAAALAQTRIQPSTANFIHKPVEEIHSTPLTAIGRGAASPLLSHPLSEPVVRAGLSHPLSEPIARPVVPGYTSSIQADLDSIRSSLASLAPRENSYSHMLLP